ncbi:MAG: right-handed parallel beta-helix repeat-containing protein [Trichloromonadaceae bacterium]
MLRVRYLAVFIIFFFFVLPFNVSGKVFYVDQGNPAAGDSNNGSEESPWLTLKVATNLAKAGDTIIVKAGEYIDDSSSHTFPYSSFNLNNEGIIGSPIIFKSEPHLAATIKAKEFPSKYLAWGINNKSNIVIDGFKIIGGMRVSNGENIVIENNEFLGGFYPPSDPSLNWGLAFLNVKNSFIVNNLVHSMIDSGNNQHNSACFMLFGDSSNNIIENNSANGSNKKIYSAFGQKGGGIDNNIFRYNYAKNVISGFLGMGSTDGTKPSKNNKIYQNIIINSHNFIELDRRAENFSVYNNTAYNTIYFLQAISNNNLGNELWNNISFYKQYAIMWRGYPVSRPFTDLIYFSNYNSFIGDNVAFREITPSIKIGNLLEWQTLTKFDLQSGSNVPIFVNPSGDNPQSFKRVFYALDGRGGEFAPVRGAYVTGDEYIGCNWCGPRVPVGIRAISNP